MKHARSSNRYIPYQQEDRQWDARFNVQLDEDLERLLEHAKREWESGKLRYLLIGGVEIGDAPYQDDYEIRHVHVALIYYNRVSKRSIIKNFGIKEGNGYYLVPRNRSLPYAGWKNHHTKVKSKANPQELCLYEMGTLPEDKDAKELPGLQKRSDEEKKRKSDEILIDMRRLIEEGKDDEAFTRWPRTYIQYGEKLKSLVIQKRDKLTANGDPHIWLHGSPGCGKTAILSYIYPRTYKKNLYNKFFDLYDPRVHDHIILEDLDHDAVDRLSTNFLKTLCDESGFAIDQKYKTPQLTRSVILVSSNFTIHEIITQSEEANVFGKQANKNALLRRFWSVSAPEFMRMLGIKIISKYEIQMLKKAGNTDPGKLFMAYDYLADCPTGEPIKSPDEYAQQIKDIYYGK